MAQKATPTNRDSGSGLRSDKNAEAEREKADEAKPKVIFKGEGVLLSDTSIGASRSFSMRLPFRS